MTGLGAAILEETVDGGGVIENIVSNNGRLVHASIKKVQANPDQPRKTFNEEDIEELAQTIRDHGILQPLVVYEDAGKLIVVAGERRLRAAKKAGLKTGPVIVRDAKSNVLELSIIENVQRSDLHPLELADALKMLAEKHNYKQEDLGLIIGKSKGTISRILALNKLPEPVRKKVSTSKLASMDQLYQVAKQPDTEKMLRLVDKIESGNLTVRETRKEVKKDKPTKGRPKNFHYTYRPPDKAFSVSISFPKPEPTTAEVKEALKATIKNIK